MKISDVFPGRAKLPILAAGIIAAAMTWQYSVSQKAREIPVQGTWQGNAAAVAAPRPEQNAMGRLLLKQLGESFLRGTAFILHRDGRPYLVSCYHVLGDNPKGATLVRQRDRLGIAAGAVAFKGRTGRFRGNCEARGEVTVMPMTSLSPAARQLKLAPAPPQVGQPVWLFHMGWEDEMSRRLSGNSQFSGRSFNTLLSRAVVTRSSNQALEMKFDSPPAIEMTSGAPVLDQNGEVVGINVGSCLRDGTVTGLAAPHQSLQAAFSGIRAD